MFETSLAGLTVALLTLFDLDSTFYVPRTAHRKAQLYGWWVGFTLANGIFAAFLYTMVDELDMMPDLPSGLRAIVWGSIYLAILRTKLTTITIQGQSVPVGFELFYEGIKGFVYKRINAIAKEARVEETKALADQYRLVELAREARLSVDVDALLSQPEKMAAKLWILNTMKDEEIDDLDKRLALANFLLSGQTNP